MSLQTLLDNVESVTKRPDARARGLIALNALILEITTNDDYAQDLIEATVLNPVTGGSFQAQLSLDLAGYPGVRKICYLTANDLPLTSLTPNNVLSASGCAQVNVFYRSGNTLVVSSKLAFTEVRLGYYQRFTGLAESVGLDQHWLMDDYEPMLVYGTIGRVFRATGDDDSAAYYEQMYLGMRKNVRAGLAEDQ